MALKESNPMPPALLNRLPRDQLRPHELQALNLASAAATEAYAPHGTTHVGAAIIPDESSKVFVTGHNTNAEDRQRRCAELLALLKLLQSKDLFIRAKTLTLAIHTARSINPNPAQPPPKPLTPCGSCLHDIQALANIGISPEKILTLVSNGLDTFSVPFTKLYPLATLGQLKSFIDQERKATQPSSLFHLRNHAKNAAKLATQLDPQLKLSAITALLTKLNRSAQDSTIKDHPSLKISVGKLCLSPEEDRAIPQIDFGFFGEGSTIVQTLCSGSPPMRPGKQQLLGLVILVKGEINRQNRNYQILSGSDRQRIVDIAAITKNTIPIIISLNNEAFIVTTIAALAPEYRTPLESNSASKRLALYTAPLSEEPYLSTGNDSDALRLSSFTPIPQTNKPLKRATKNRPPTPQPADTPLAQPPHQTSPQPAHGCVVQASSESSPHS